MSSTRSARRLWPPWHKNPTLVAACLADNFLAGHTAHILPVAADCTGRTHPVVGRDRTAAGRSLLAAVVHTVAAGRNAAVRSLLAAVDHTVAVGRSLLAADHIAETDRSRLGAGHSCSVALSRGKLGTGTCELNPRVTVCVVHIK